MDIVIWIFTLIALLLTFPIWITVNYLGNPDNGVIIASYIGSALIAGAYISVGICISSVTNNQVISFVISATISFLLTVSGLPIVLDFFTAFSGQIITDAVASFSFLTNYFYYTLSPKSDWMLNHIADGNQAKAWLYVYRKHQVAYHGGLALGLIAMGFFAFAFRC